MNYQTLYTEANVAQYFDTDRLVNSTYALKDVFRVVGYKPYVNFEVTTCLGQKSHVAMTSGMLDHVISVFSDSERTAADFAGNRPEEVAKRGMDKLLPVFVAARDTMNALMAPRVATPTPQENILSVS